ncbi:MAG: hypothetical protein LBB81_07185 [Treponema sp.]|jgi:hypothetical protein|nr:hypothetical protein [Treponema sp.]
MKRYNIKSQDGKREYVDILNESEDTYLVRFTRIRNGCEKITEETITKQLFAICLQTGYLYQENDHHAEVRESSAA